MGDGQKFGKSSTRLHRNVAKSSRWRLVEVPSLTGNEQPIAECVHRILGDMGADTYMQEFEPGRYNAIGRVRGAGGGAHCL